MLSDNDINQVKEIIRQAGKAILEEYQAVDLEIISKEDNSPLTNADLRSHEIINKGLKGLETKFPIISEESVRIEAHERMIIPTFWLVDPLDGTKEFIHKNGEFAVCIALIHKEKSIAGFVYAPVKNELFYAVEGRGAILEKNFQRKELKTREFTLNEKHIRIAVSRSHRSKEEDEYILQFEEPQLITKGSILKMTEIAAGNMEIYPRFDQMTKEWDIAAGQIILEEAGGEVIHRISNEPIRYNKTTLQNPPFIARAKTV